MNISLLTVLLFALVSPIIIDFTIFHDAQRSLYYGLIFFLLIGMAVFDLKKPGTKLRNLTVWLIIILTIGLGCVIYVFDRYKISVTYRTHDIVIQQEIATRMLLTGKNPYAETYHNSALKEFKFSATEENPALYHFVMEPFYLVSSVPFYFIQSRTLGFFDARIPLYLLFFAMLFAGYKFIKDKENKLLFVSLMAFNPMTLRFVLEGRSDMFMYPFLFASFILLHKRKFALSAAFTALAFAIKQTAWPFFPLWLFFLWLKTNDRRKILRYLAVFIIVFGTFVLPFFLWNPKAFLDSTLFYLSGNTLHSYPVSGYGFSSLLREFKIIKDVHSYYPFIFWQALVGIPVLVLLLRNLKKNPTTKVLIASYAIFLFIFWYFSRYFNDSHIGFISSILITAYFWPEEEKTSSRIRN